eukprot:Pgem_evm1s1977
MFRFKILVQILSIVLLSISTNGSAVDCGNTVPNSYTTNTTDQTITFYVPEDDVVTELAYFKIDEKYNSYSGQTISGTNCTHDTDVSYFNIEVSNATDTYRCGTVSDYFDAGINVTNMLAHSYANVNSYGYNDCAYGPGNGAYALIGEMQIQRLKLYNSGGTYNVKVKDFRILRNVIDSNIVWYIGGSNCWGNAITTSCGGTKQLYCEAVD